MAFVNLPPNFQDMFYALSDRIMKLETGPNQAMYTAESAQGSSAQASVEAGAALIAANAAAVQSAQAISQAGAAFTLAGTKNTVFYQPTTPTAIAVDDQWINTAQGNKLYLWTGTAWVSAQDTAIASAQSAATAAQTTADGKNKIYRQAGSPPLTGNSIGDTWFNTSSDNAISRWNGSSWEATSLGTNALANFSANKITSGSIDASVVTVSNLNAGNISTGTLAADRIAAASITGAKLVANTITASQIATGTITATQIAAGTITATEIAATTITAAKIAAGTITATQIATGTITATQIAAGTITTDKLTAGTLTGFTVQTSAGTNAVILQGSSNALSFKVSGSVVGNIVPLSSFGVLTHYGATPDPSGGTFPQMFVGSANVSMFANASNGIGVGTSTGVQINGTTSLNSQTNYPGIATGSGSTMVVVTTGSRIAFTTSSERYKQDISYITSTGWLDKVLQMKPITYKTSVDFTTADEPNETQIGFLAEDIYDIGGGLEKAVVLDPLGDPFSLSYDRLTVFLALAIKEQDARLKILEGN